MAKSRKDQLTFANREILENGNLDFVEKVFASSYVVHAPGKDYKGHAFIRRFVKELRAAIPNLRLVQLEVLLETKDTIAWRRTLTGTHKAELKRIPPSGRKVQWCEMFVSRFEGDKIAEEWMVSDLAAQLMFKLPPK